MDIAAARQQGTESIDGFEVYLDVRAFLRLEVPFVACDPNLASDFNADGRVDLSDLLLQAADWPQQQNASGDLNGDGTLNIQDMVLVSEDLFCVLWQTSVP